MTGRWKTFLLIPVLSLMLTPIVYAVDSDYAASFHVENGQRLLSQGKTELAVNQFLKALIYDTANTTAKDNLRQIAQETSSWTTKQRMELFHFVELIDYVNFLQNRQKYLVTSNSMIAEFILSHAEITREVRREIRADQAKLVQFGPKSSGVVLQQLLNTESIVLGNANEQLGEFKKKLIVDLESLQEIYKRLRQEKLEIISGLQMVTVKPAPTSLAKQVQEIRQKLIEKDLLLKKQENNYTQLKQEMESVNQEFLNLHDKLKETNQKITELTRDLAGMSLEVFSKEKQLADRETRVNSLETELREAQERLNLVQRIIQEKEISPYLLCER